MKASTIAWIVGGGLLVWVLIAGFLFLKDSPARAYAENTVATTTEVQRADSNPWMYFFWGYMLGGNNSYTEYRYRTNDTYRGSPEYQESVRTVPSGNWGTDAPADDSSGSWGSGWSWSSDDSGSWGSNSSSWDDWSSDSSGSWGSDSGWDMGSSYDSGSWGGSDSSWSSSGSGSWGE